MADEPEDDGVPGEAEGPLCGERLKAARTDRAFDVATVARHLHVDAATVEALERNDFERLGAPVFARGHLRKYAEFVKLPPDEILDDYRSLQSTSELPPVVAPRPPGRVGFKPPPWLFGLLAALLLLAVLLFWFLSGGEPSTPTAAPATSSQEAAGAPPPETQRPESEPPPALEDDVSLEATGATSAAAAAVVPSSGQDRASSDATLTLIYSGECWTEVRDGNGRRLYSGTGNVGDRRTLRGQLPFAIVLGNRSTVELRLNGEIYPVPDGRTRLARFSIPDA